MKYFYVYDRFNKKEQFVVKADSAKEAVQKLITQKNTTDSSTYSVDDFIVRELVFEDDIVRL